MTVAGVTHPAARRLGRPGGDGNSGSRVRSTSLSRDEVMTTGQQVGNDMVALGIGVAAAGLVIAACLAQQVSRSVPMPIEFLRSERPQPATVTAARRLNRAAGTLAVSVLADSAMEHYRGSFFNRAMFAPLIASALSLAVSAHGVADARRGAHIFRDLVYACAALTGVVGTAFHVYNVAARPGRFCWENLFYGAPLGAPSALLLSGLLGFMAERVRDARPGETPTFLGIPAGRLTAGVTAAGLLGTSGEAGLLHFRGAYHNPFMFVPVTIPPAAALVMAEVALGRPRRHRTFSRWFLRLTAALGLAGVGFHAYGVHRNMGGWRNWRQNILNGPPLPAPPSFAGLALAGLAALALLQERPDA